MPLLQTIHKPKDKYQSNKAGLSAVSFSCPKPAQPHRGKKKDAASIPHAGLR
jgi:hypothetical protein